MSEGNQSEITCVEAKGPWPFVTRRAYPASDQENDPSQRKRTWSSRHHRKGLLLRSERKAEAVAVRFSSYLWNPRSLNWWIGSIFAIGSLLFAVASVLSLTPALAAAWSLQSMQINAIFFAGSIPFTTAGYLQLFQAANADRETGSGRWKLFGWHPQDVGWLSSVLQFIGTILFNFNTFDAMIPSLNWFGQDLLIWAPNIIGSILFLGSGYLGFIETCHAYWACKPKSISWWVVFTNLLGCVGFMIAALFAIVLPTADTEAVTLSVVFTLLGAIGFLVGSLLMLPETVLEHDA